MTRRHPTQVAQDRERAIDVGKLRGLVEQGREWPLGSRVRKRSGSSWSGKIVGYYSTALTPEGIAVESENEPGSVQIYPTKAMEMVERNDASPSLLDEVERLRGALEPFAHYAELFDDEDGCTDCPDHYPISSASDRDEPTIGDCRKARLVLGRGVERG